MASTISKCAIGSYVSVRSTVRSGAFSAKEKTACGLDVGLELNTLDLLSRLVPAGDKKQAEPRPENRFWGPSVPLEPVMQAAIDTTLSRLVYQFGTALLVPFLLLL